MIETLVPGDSLSQLVQIRARNFDIRIKWTGRAIEDIDQLCQEYWNRKNFNECLWDNGLRELMTMPEYGTLPEAMQAKIASIVLKARAHFELKVSQRLQGTGKLPPGSAA
jgi:hypothetical protein